MKELFRLVSTFLKVSVREKSNLFWVMIFPLILFTMMYAAFSGADNIKPEDLNLKLGIAPGHPDAFLLKQIDILELREIAPENMGEALRKGEIDAFVTDELGMIVENSYTAAEIIRGILTEIKQTRSLGMRALTATGNRGTYYEKNDVRNGSLTVSFYNIFAMFSLYGYFCSSELVRLLQADQSRLAERNAVSPMRKSVGLAAAILTSLIVVVISMTMLLILSEAVLQQELIRNWPASILILLAGGVFGVAEGVFFGSLNLPEWLLNLIGIGGSLFMSMLSGMMGITVRNLVALHAPWLNQINPVSVVTETFYRVNLLGRAEELGRAVIFLSACSLVFFLLSTFKLKRTTFEKLS